MEEFRKDPKNIYTNFGPKMGFIGSFKVMKTCHVPQIFAYKHSNPILWRGMRIHGPVKEVDLPSLGKGLRSA